MNSLADANVLFPIVVTNHVHNRSALAWWNAQEAESVVMCLPVRMALLRLLTNHHVMRGDALFPEQAWDTCRRLEQDARMICRFDTPAAVDAFWLANIRGREATPNLWTDAWLASFAEAAGLEMVTFDKGFRQFNLTRLKVLKT